VRALTDLRDGRLRRPDQLDDLRVLQLRMVFHQPEDRVRPVLTPRSRRVSRGLLRLDLRQLDLRFQQLELIQRIGFGALDLVAAQFSTGDRVLAANSGGNVTIGDPLDLENVQTTELGDLVERQRRVLDKPHGGRFRHQRAFGAHGIRPFFRAARGPGGTSAKIPGRLCIYVRSAELASVNA
jgi:hypothetical protein